MTNSYLSGIKFIGDSSAKIIALIIWATFFFLTPFLISDIFHLALQITVGVFLLLALVFSFSPGITRKWTIIVVLSPLGWAAIAFAALVGFSVLGFLWYLFEGVLFIVATAPLIKFLPPKSDTNSFFTVFLMQIFWATVSIALVVVFAMFSTELSLNSLDTGATVLLALGTALVLLTTFTFLLLSSSISRYKYIRGKIPLSQISGTIVVIYWVYRYIQADVSSSSFNNWMDIAFSVLAVILAVRNIIQTGAKWHARYTEKRSFFKRFIPRFPLHPYASVLWIYAISLSSRFYDATTIQNDKSIAAIIFIPVGIYALLKKIYESHKEDENTE